MTQGIEILLVEDNPEDADMVKRALKKSNILNKLLHVEDGKEALDFLYNEENQMPRVILLDMKMPRVDGLEVLRKLKSDEKKKIIPVVMLTSSKEERDILETYRLGVNAYIVKPVDYENFVTTISQLGLFWILLNQPPR